FSNMMQKQMLYFFPLFTVFILWKLPAAIGVYWTITALFSIFQQYLIMKPQKENA
ncbi:MAG: YidC/Oxa1 family membrane protein insertase, partial [Candidatus Nealsonbacteria bacterium]|nr:YidC/Oxa1 family membrane protein insertase [Candidatus Nealsonbacteria bacterium]